MVDQFDHNFAKVMNYPDDRDKLHVFDFSKGYKPDLIRNLGWGIGRYNEIRKEMYQTSLFNSRRNIHMGIDIWAPVGEPVFSFWEGRVMYMQDNNNPGDYGPTIVISYQLNESVIYGLYGHLSKESMEIVSVGDKVEKGQKIATLGSQEVNGGWVPHLHFQISIEDPNQADMPGVVAKENREEALATYPDPRIIVGDLYDD